MIGRILKAIKKRLPVYRQLKQVNGEVATWKKGLYPPGHYYSPVSDPRQIPGKNDRSPDGSVPGVNLREQEQVQLLEHLRPLYKDDLFPTTISPGFRYYFINDYFSYSDGIFLHLIMRHFKPKRIIEVGSGFSSALMLDTNERFLDNKTHLTFIEPYPEDRLNHLLKTGENCLVMKEFVQQVALDRFQALQAGDILFIDSSHVSKYQSDLNYIMFEILPALNSGVIIHFHDVFFPFEYPWEWIKQGRSWNEGYLLRAFLQYNQTFDILLFTSFMETKHRDWFHQNMSVCLTPHEKIDIDGNTVLMQTTGQSIYLQKR